MAQKRPVAPDTPIVAYPTPEVLDIVITVDVDSRLPGYKSLEYGTLYPDQTRFPGAKLISQIPLEGEGDRFVRRIYATDRVNQDSYNYAIKYSAGSPEHPIYTRTTVESREGYAPLADGAPDPAIPGAYLVDEEAAPADEGLDSLYLKVTRVYETLPGPVVTSYDTNEAGQKVTQTSQRKTSTDYSLPQATALSSSSAEADGTGVVNETTRTIPSIFARQQFSAERPDMLPQKFRAAVPDVETSEIIEGTAEQPVLNTGDISASQTQQTLFVKQVSRRSRSAPTYPVTITEYSQTNRGQLGTTVSTLALGGQTADIGALIESSEVSSLGDGRTIKVTTSVDQVFGEINYSKSIDDVTPQKFRAALTETVEESTVTGVASMPTTLESGVISKTEQQVTVQKKRVQVRSRQQNALTTELSGGFLFTGDLGGGNASIQEEYGSQPTITTGFGTISAEKEALGNGKYVTRHVVLSSPPELKGQIYDEQLDLVVPFTQQVISASTPQIIGTDRVEIAPRDVYHSVKKSVDIDDFRAKALSEFWAIPAYIDVRLPDYLTSVTVTYAKSTSTGGATGTGSSWSVQASGSTSMAGEVNTTIKNGYNGPVPATRYIFFIERTGVTISTLIAKIESLGGSAEKWPTIITEPVNMVVAGGSVTESQFKSFTVGSNTTLGSSANSTSFSSEPRVGFVTIQPTLHDQLIVARGDDISIAGPTASGATLSVNSPTLTPSFSPAIITPTSYKTFPTGDFIANIDTESYKYGLVRATVVVAHITEEYV